MHHVILIYLLLGLVFVSWLLYMALKSEDDITMDGTFQLIGTFFTAWVLWFPILMYALFITITESEN
jgi:hypothetical protein